ncbi:MAG: hypothetical protein ATN31_07820 [Candidatus Epulonipiscioides saccharophilum]|nr:MAG: hypothetical protein ATN31_07820 [Epulopiscium sp. AS2M-Bin001]
MALNLNSDMTYSVQNSDRNIERANAQVRAIQESIERQQEEDSAENALPQPANNPTALSVGPKMVSAYIGLTVETSNVESQNPTFVSETGVLSTAQNPQTTAQDFSLMQNDILTSQLQESAALYTTEEEEDAGALYEDELSPQEALEAELAEIRVERALEQEELATEHEAELSQQSDEAAEEITQDYEESLVESFNSDTIAATAANIPIINAADETSSTIKNNLLDQYRFQMQSRWQSSAMNMMNQMTTLFNL